MGYLKKMARRIRPGKKLKNYVNFFRQEGLYQEIDSKKIRRWPDELLKEEQEKAEKRMKKLEEFEKLAKKLLTIILVIFILIAIIQPEIYWVAKIAIVVIFVIYATGFVVLLMLDAKAKGVLEKNTTTIRLEKAKRVMKRRDYSNVEAIDSPKLCAILARVTEPIIDEVRCEDGAFYNIYVNGICYKLKQDSKLEQQIEIID